MNTPMRWFGGWMPAILTGAVLQSLAPLHLQAATWDLTADFSAVDNPNGSWSYGWSQGLAGPLNLYGSRVDLYWGTVLYSAQDAYGNYCPDISQNDAIHSMYGVEPGQVALHPGNFGEVSVARWTSPVAGTVSVSGEFGAGNFGVMSYHVAVNGSLVQEWINDPATEPFLFTTSVAPGSTIDFVVGSDINYTGGSTPLRATIRTLAVPEPTSMLAGALLLLPFGASALRMARKRRQA